MGSAQAPVRELQKALMVSQSGEIYTQRFRAELPAETSVENLLQALGILHRRHEVLRLRFHWDSGNELTQWLVPDSDFSLTLFDHRTLSLERSQFKEEKARVELSNDNLHTFGFILSPEGRRQLLWTSHHAALDGYSRRIVWEELLALLQDPNVNLPEAPSWLSYTRWRETRKSAAATEFWTNYLQGLQKVPPSQRSTPASVRQNAPPLPNFGVPRTVVLQAVWALTLRKLRQEDDIVFGTVRNGRRSDFPEVKSLVGLVVNTLPVRVQFRPDLTFGSLLQQLQGHWSDLTAVEEWEQGGSYCQTIVSFDAESRPDSWKLDAPSHHPLALTAHGRETLELQLQFDSQMFQRADAEAILKSVLWALQELSWETPLHETLGPELPYWPENSSVSSPARAGLHSLAKIWENILGKNVQDNTNFFSAGTDSLQLMRMLTLAGKLFDLRLSPEEVMNKPELNALAAHCLGLPPGLTLSREPPKEKVQAAVLSYLPEWLPEETQLSREFIRSQWAQGEAFVSRILETNSGKIAVITLPVFGDELYLEPDRLSKIAYSASEFAQSLGAKAISMAGLLPSALAYGETLESPVPLTTGHASTVSAVVLSILRALRELGRDLSEERLAFLGLGSIGRATLDLLLKVAGPPKELLLCDLEGRLQGLEHLDATLLTYKQSLPQALNEASLIVGATNAGEVLPLGALKSGAVIFDDSWPPCFPVEETTRRPDLLFLECGFLESPSPLRQRSFAPADLSPDIFLRWSLFHPNQLTGCVLSSVLTATEEAPVTRGLPSSEHTLEWFELVQKLGYSAPAPQTRGQGSRIENFRRFAPTLERPSSLLQRFLDMVARHGSQAALAQEDKVWTYQELHQWSDRLALWLQEQGVREGGVVALDMPRSAEMIALLLAVWKAGGIYLTLDPESPEKRKQAQMAQSETQVLIKEVPTPGDSRLRDYPKNPSEVAVLVYTSGTTGEPKGIELPEAGILRGLVDNHFKDFKPQQSYLFHSSPAFDISLMEIWGPLLNGGCCRVLPCGTRHVNALKEAISRPEVTFLTLTTSVFHLLVDSAPEIFEELEEVYVAGEALSCEHSKKVLSRCPSLRLVNFYGPAENSIVSTYFEVPHDLPEDLLSMPIGHSVGDSTVFVLDEQRAPCEVDQKGEIWVGGLGLAKGYKNNPALTAEKFVELSLGRLGRLRLYRTGDLGSWDKEGRLRFHGRSDRQVKHHGFRIELDEIEAILNRQSGVSQSAVKMKNREIHAFVELSGIQSSDLRNRLRKELPSYMMPREIQAVAKLPLTVNGKLDRSLL